MRQRRSVVNLALLFEGGLVVVAVAAGWLLGTPAFVNLSLQMDAFAQGVAATLPILLLLTPLANRSRPLKNLRDFVSRQVLPLFKNASLVQLAVISVLAGLGEEALFRGVLQSWLVKQIGIYPGLILASVAFGLAHFVNRTYAVVATLIGLYLGWLYLVSGNLLVPVIAHALYDFVALIVLLREGKRELSRSRIHSE